MMMMMMMTVTIIAQGRKYISHRTPNQHQQHARPFYFYASPPSPGAKNNHQSIAIFLREQYLSGFCHCNCDIFNFYPISILYIKPVTENSTSATYTHKTCTPKTILLPTFPQILSITNPSKNTTIPASPNHPEITLTMKLFYTAIKTHTVTFHYSPLPYPPNIPNHRHSSHSHCNPSLPQPRLFHQNLKSNPMQIFSSPGVQPTRSTANTFASRRESRPGTRE